MQGYIHTFCGMHICIHTYGVHTQYMYVWYTRHICTVPKERFQPFAHIITRGHRRVYHLFSDTHTCTNTSPNLSISLIGGSTPRFERRNKAGRFHPESATTDHGLKSDNEPANELSFFVASKASPIVLCYDSTYLWSPFPALASELGSCSMEHKKCSKISRLEESCVTGLGHCLP